MSNSENEQTPRLQSTTLREREELVVVGIRIFASRYKRLPGLTELAKLINEELLPLDRRLLQQAADVGYVVRDLETGLKGVAGLAKVAMKNGIFEAVVIDGELFTDYSDPVEQDITKLPTDKLIRSMADIAKELVSRNLK